MTTDKKIWDEKLQYNINRDDAKRSALSSGKIDKYEYLTGEEILPSNRSYIIEKAKFAYSPSGKALEKQTQKQVNALKSFNLPNKIDELKQIDDIFPQNQMNDLICDRLKKISKLQDNIKLNYLKYEAKIRKHYHFSKFSLSIICNLFKKLNNISKDDKPIEKMYLLKHVRILLEARENVLNSFISNRKFESVWPLKPPPSPPHHPLIFQEERI